MRINTYKKVGRIATIQRTLVRLKTCIVENTSRGAQGIRPLTMGGLLLKPMYLESKVDRPREGWPLTTTK